MPGWSSRTLHSNPTTPATSNHRTLESEFESSDDYFTPILPPSLQDPANPFGNTAQAYPIRGSPSRGHGHARSVSDKVPSLFGIGRKKSNSNFDFESRSVPNDKTLDGNIESAAAVGLGPSVGDDEEYDTGRCATCDQKVKWPKQRAEYRCAICSMINDLTPKTFNALLPSLSADTAESTMASNVSHIPSLSIESTQTLIDQCILTYLYSCYPSGAIRDSALLPSTEIPPNFSRPRNLSCTGLDMKNVLPSLRQMGDSLLSPNTVQSIDMVEGDLPIPSDRDSRDRLHPVSLPRGRPGPIPGLSTRKPVPKQDGNLPSGPRRYPSPSPTSPRPSSHKPSSSGEWNARAAPTSPEAVLHHAPQLSRQPSHQSATPTQTYKVIFKPLEELITRIFGCHEYLNSTFMKQSRRPQTASTARNYQHQSPTRKDTPDQTPLFQIDPKTLLLGDIAENGLWWTGKHDRTMATTRSRSHKEHKQMERPSGLVSSRSPYISWVDAVKWYSIVINVGRGWRTTLQAHKQDYPQKSQLVLSHEDEISIDAAMAEARLHVQRVLLRTSDNVLKRPGRPLKDPGDFRFLLVLLANPMLYPASSRTSEEAATGNSLEQNFSRLDQGAKPSQATPASGEPDAAWDQSNAFAIAKRILGLLSNTSGECQRYLTSWFSRYDEAHFRSLLGLIQMFISRRLRRQNNRRQTKGKNMASDLIPSLSGSSSNVSAELHAALGLSGKAPRAKDNSDDLPYYSDDWQVRAAARVMALLFAANKSFIGERMQATLAGHASMSKPGSLSRNTTKAHGQLVPITDFYNTMVDFCDVIIDFDTWEGFPSKFAFCQYPFLLSVGSKIRIMEHDARRQMEIKAREAFFKSLLRNAAVQQYMLLRVRRECLVEDSLKGISEVVAQGQEEIKKGLKVQFLHEEGVDAGGLRKEWFLLLVREIFDPLHAMFVYDDDSNLCYFNPHSFETSDQYFLVGALLGLAIYNSTILDVALPPFIFKKLLLSGGAFNPRMSTFIKGRLRYSLEDLAEWRPQLAKGLQSLLEFEGNVQEIFCRDFVIDIERYGAIEQVELCSGGAKRPVTNENRYEYVELYVRYLLDTQVSRQFEPFKRGFFTVCGGNALSLFQPEEIELLVRGSDEPLDVPSLKAVATYGNWRTASPKCQNPSVNSPLVCWFWEVFEAASTNNQRKLLGFITGSDRIPAMGATSLIIKVVYGGPDARRLPIARTCFNQVLLYGYGSRQELEQKLWLAVFDSQGFGLV